MKCIVWTVKYWRHHQNMTKIGQIFESKSFSIICLVHKLRRASKPHIYLPLFVSLFQHRWDDPSPHSLSSYISVSLLFLFCCIAAIQQVYFPLVKTFTPPRHDFVLQKLQKKRKTQWMTVPPYTSGDQLKWLMPLFYKILEFILSESH